MKKQKIILDAFQYDAAITGTDRMAYNFLRELQTIDTVNQYFVICSSENYIPSVITPKSNFKVFQPLLAVKHPFLRRISNKIWHELTLGFLKFKSIDTYYSFHNMRLPRLKVAKRMIASNLDLITLKLSEYAGLGRLQPSQERAQLDSVAKSADMFVSISEFSKQELHKTLGVAEKNIVVIPLAADPIFGRASGGIKKLPALPKNFLFTLGGSEPRKNVRTVVDAFCALPTDVQQAFPLYIAGGPWHGSSLSVFNKSPFIHTLGYISDDTLVHIYRQATAFIFASMYEGFGFTILEAMTCGTPVITAKNTSLSEVAGEATMLFESTNHKDLIKKIDEIIHSKNLQKTLSQKGLKRAQEFSWNKSAQTLNKLLLGKY